MESYFDNTEIRKYFNKLGEMPQEKIPEYVNKLIDNYDKYLKSFDRDSLVKEKSNVESAETSFFSKKKSLERIAKLFYEVGEEVSFIDAWKFKRDFDF